MIKQFERNINAFGHNPKEEIFSDTIKVISGTMGDNKTDWNLDLRSWWAYWNWITNTRDSIACCRKIKVRK